MLFIGIESTPSSTRHERMERWMLSVAAEAECICQKLPHKTKAKPGEAGSIWKRKKETEEGSFRGQRKRNVSAKGSRTRPKRSPAKRVRFGKGRRRQRKEAFANSGSGMYLPPSDVTTPASAGQMPEHTAGSERGTGWSAVCPAFVFWHRGTEPGAP